MCGELVQRTNHPRRVHGGYLDIVSLLQYSLVAILSAELKLAVLVEPVEQGAGLLAFPVLALVVGNTRTNLPYLQYPKANVVGFVYVTFLCCLCAPLRPHPRCVQYLLSSSSLVLRILYAYPESDSPCFCHNSRAGGTFGVLCSFLFHANQKHEN